MISRKSKLDEILGAKMKGNKHQELDMLDRSQKLNPQLLKLFPLSRR